MYQQYDMSKITKTIDPHLLGPRWAVEWWIWMVGVRILVTGRGLKAMMLV